MCRLIGIAANEATEFRIVLREAPRSLAFLSREHRDGWGIAVFDSESGTWQLDKGIACAGEDERFHRLAVGTRGHLLVAHIRQKTIGTPPSSTPTRSSATAGSSRTTAPSRTS